MIRRLSHLLNFAEDIVEDVRKTPANALFSHHLLNKHKNEDSVDKSSLIDEIVEVFLKKATYLVRSAPLAALTILRESTRELEGKSIGPRRRITTLDFGKPDNWKHQSGIEDPIRTIYLDAHHYWIQNPPNSDFIDGTEERGIVKYLVWSNANLEQVDDDNLIRKYNNMSEIEFRIFPEALMAYVHDVLDRIYPSVRLRSTQFFVWDTADEPHPIIINRRDFDEENSEDTKTCGFYSPAKTSDLTSGIVHLKTDPDNGDLESRVKRVRYENIKDYVTLLEKLHKNK